MTKYPKILSLIMGVLAVSALPPYYLFFSLFISFSVLLYLLNGAQKPKSSFAYGYWFGFGFYAVGLSWINNALMLDLPRLGWLIPITFCASGAFFGLFAAIPALISHFFRNFYAKILSFAAVWVFMEWIRSFIFTGFPWNILSTTLAFSPTLMQSASLFGSYGLSLLLLIICSLPATFVDKDKRTASALIIFISAIVAILFGSWRLKSLPNNEYSETKVRLVQPSIPQTMKWDNQMLENNLNTYVEMSVVEGFEDVDVVIWGETANPFVPQFEPEYFAKLLQAVPQKGFLITGSLNYSHDGEKWRPRNAMFAIDKQGIVASYNKSHLVPFGEYIPLRKYLPESLKPVTNVISDFMPGDGRQTINLLNIPPFSPLICYEIIFPSQVADATPRPHWLANLTNDGWYGAGAGPYQHLVTAQMRAVEEGLTIVRAANSGISALISKTGMVLKEIPLNKKASLDVFLPRNLHIQTLYAKYGNIIPLLMVLICLLLSLAVDVRERRTK